MARVLLGVTGGIAAYKACELVRLLVKGGHDVIPLVTPGAERFVRAETFTALARRPAEGASAGAERKPAAGSGYPHLERADLLVVAPCTANTLAKLAHGLADNVLTEAALAHRGPFLVAPAMNVRMWEHPATQENAARLRERGVEFVGPETGDLAEGEAGAGRMAEPATIHARIRELLGDMSPDLVRGRGASGQLAGKKVLVTAGGTREPLDSVRYLGNRSSGRMGVALADEARRRGAEVTLLAANLTVPPPPGVEVIETPTADDLAREALAHADADLVLMAAAVADYRPREVLSGKRPKGEQPWVVELVPTVDVARTLGERRTDGQVLVAFGADAEQGLERKRRMLETKNVDVVVFNDVSRADIGFDVPDNEVVVVTRTSERRLPKAPKDVVAAAILDEVARLRTGGDGRADGR